MAFFDKLTEMANLDKLNEMAKSVSERMDESLELNNLTSEINLTKGNIDVYKREIGEYYWAKFAVGEKLDDEPMLTCDKIVVAQEKIRELEAKIAQIKDAGIENVMALRGDLTPEMEGQDRSGWAYRHAVDLIRDIRESGADFCIGGACYPETHPESAGSREDIENLKKKVDAGVEFLTTQMFFDNNILYNFMYRMMRGGVDVPVVAGIMPVTNAAQIKRIISISNNALPQSFVRIVDRYGHSPEAMNQAGIAFATQQIIDLFANGVNAVHVYSMNKPDVAKAIQDNVSSIIK